VFPFLEDHFHNILSHLEILASNPNVKKRFREKVSKSKLSKEDYCPVEDTFEHLGGMVDSLYRIDSKGIVQGRIPFKEGMEGRDFSKKPGVKFVLENHERHAEYAGEGHKHVSEVFTTESGGKAISICVPVFENDEFLGMLRVLFYLNTINNIISHIKIGKKGYAWMIDDSGITVAHPKLEYIGKDIMAARKAAFPNYDWFELENIVARMAGGEEGVGTYHSAWWREEKLQLIRKLTAYAPIRVGDELWSIGVSMDYDEILAPIIAHSRNTLIAVAFLILILIGMEVIFWKIQKEKAKLKIEAQSAGRISSINRQLEREIAKRKQAEEEVRETKDYLDDVIESTLDPIVTTNSKGYVTRANKSFFKLLGCEEEEAIGRHMAEFSPLKEGTYESTTGELVEINEEFFDSMKRWMSRLVEEGRISNIESYNIRNDNKVIPVEDNIVYLYNKEGERTGAVGIIRDITERRKAEKEIKEARDFLESVIESSRDGIIICDEKGYIISANTALEKMCRFRKEEMIGEHASLLTTEDKDMRKEIREKTISELFGKGFTSYKAKYKNKDGKTIDVECNTSMIKNEKGDYFAGVSIIRDITERREMEHKLLQSEKLKSLGELAGGVAHDFNNVLAAILGRAQLLKMIVEPPPGKQEGRKSVIELKKGLEIIEKASRDGAETVRRIQEFARRREEDRYFTMVNLNEIIENALEFSRVRWKDDAESKGIKINLQKEFSSLPLTSGSAAELREVFTNLINNAIDAMPQGGNIKIKTFKEDSHISVKVEDTGTGISKAIRDRIFDPFLTTKGVKSSGLGLSVSYGIINRHRGNITVDSVEGKGTAFIIKLPISEKVIETEQVKAIPEEQRKARILVIEDEENVLNILSAILIKGGHQVETASDGSQGIEMFEKEEFDLVFTDLGMPSMSGWQVAEKVKGINKRVPVALITGWNIELNESEMRKSGVDLLVYKPFEVNQVLRLVQEGMVLRDLFKAA